MEANEIIMAIGKGEFDDNLDSLTETIRWRRDILGQLNGITLKAGDRVRFVDTVRPAYLAGALGTIRNKRTKKFTVDLDIPVGRFSRGIVVPPNLLKKVEA